MSLSPYEQKALQSFKERVQRLLGGDFVSMTLFGSRARDEGDESSDLDVLVLVRNESSSVRNSVIDVSADILVETDIDISPLIFSEDHFEDMRRRERLLVTEIDRDGQLL